MKVADILNTKGNEVFSVKKTETVCDTVKLTGKHKIGSITVVDEQGAIAGILTERDVLCCV